MSAYTTIRTKLVSRDYLVQALHDMGYTEVETFDRPTTLVGYFGEDESSKAEVIIRKPNLGGASADVGFAKDRNGSFTAVINDMDRKRFGYVWVEQIAQRYAYHVARDQLADKGFELVEEQVEQDRSIRLTLRRVA